MEKEFIVKLTVMVLVAFIIFSTVVWLDIHDFRVDFRDDHVISHTYLKNGS